MSQVCRHWRTALISSALPWTRIDCQSLAQTIVGLERHRSVPLHLELWTGFSDKAWNAVLDHGNEHASVVAYLTPKQLDLVHERLVTPSVEQILLFTDEDDGPPELITVDIRGEFRSLRRLLVSGFTLPIDHIEAPNLIHLVLEALKPSSEYTAHSVLDILQGCPQLETVLLNCLVNPTEIQPPYPPITLPNLRSIELGNGETQSGLILPLRFPPAVPVGFREMSILADSTVRESIQHILAGIDIQSVTLARLDDGDCGELVRYEGPKGSLEITAYKGFDPYQHRELLLSHSPKLDNVKTLRIMDFDACDDIYEIFTSTVSAMNNLISISFVGHPLFPEPLIPKGDLPVLLPHLKHISGLHPGSQLVELARARKGKGVPLNVLDVDGSPEDGETAFIRELRELVEVVKVWRCGSLPEYWTENLVRDVWGDVGYLGPVSVCWRRKSVTLSSFIEDARLATDPRVPVISSRIVEGPPLERNTGASTGKAVAFMKIEDRLHPMRVSVIPFDTSA